MPNAAVDPPADEAPASLAGASPAFLLMALGRILRDQVEDELRGKQLSLRHLSALGHLAHRPGLSYSELGRRVGVTAQSMQATLTHLESLDAVERRTPAGRGRTAQLHVTRRGRNLLARGRRTLEAADARLLAAVPAAYHAQLTSLLLQAFTALAPAGPGPGDTSPPAVSGSL